MEWISCAVVYTVLYGLTRSLTDCTIANTIIHDYQFFKSFKNHTRLSRIHSIGPSVTRIRPWLVRLYVRFTRMANRISRVFCVRQALGGGPVVVAPIILRGVFFAFFGGWGVGAGWSFYFIMQYVVSFLVL